MNGGKAVSCELLFEGDCYMDGDKTRVNNGKTSSGIKAFEFHTVVVGVILSVLSAIVCVQIIGKVGTSANTSILGAIFAMLFGKLSIGSWSKFKSLERQNYIQTITSGAGFAAANCAFIAIGIFLMMGDMKGIVPMAMGSLFGTVISIGIVGKLFDSKIFPAAETGTL